MCRCYFGKNRVGSRRKETNAHGKCDVTARDQLLYASTRGVVVGTNRKSSWSWICTGLLYTITILWSSSACGFKRFCGGSLLVEVAGTSSLIRLDIPFYFVSMSHHVWIKRAMLPFRIHAPLHEHPGANLLFLQSGLCSPHPTPDLRLGSGLPQLGTPTPDIISGLMSLTGGQVHLTCPVALSGDLTSPEDYHSASSPPSYSMDHSGSRPQDRNSSRKV
ncbi:hypothetical protein CEXT_539881 [Caerostris extrusa]|uniref:Cytochrome c biogenesis B n=1 Tax=Caerostris extrusa TaxID=172846 RepID=A0AAV4WGU9_CAEEX|nr:hypothetical protein CEXT_539881 [Caerostris extrusa]